MTVFDMFSLHGVLTPLEKEQHSKYNAFKKQVDGMVHLIQERKRLLKEQRHVQEKVSFHFALVRGFY